MNSIKFTKEHQKNIVRKFTEKSGVKPRLMQRHKRFKTLLTLSLVMILSMAFAFSAWQCRAVLKAADWLDHQLAEIGLPYIEECGEVLMPGRIFNLKKKRLREESLLIPASC